MRARGDKGAGARLCLARAVLALVTALALMLLPGCAPGGSSVASPSTAQSQAATSVQRASDAPDEDGSYTAPDEVALYLHIYGHLPVNFITKGKARGAGWVPSKGNLDKVCPGMSIGGDRFYNDENQLPDAQGRTWTECDVNYHGGSRGAERVVFSNDGLIYYTADHYRSFTRLY